MPADKTSLKTKKWILIPGSSGRMNFLDSFKKTAKIGTLTTLLDFERSNSYPTKFRKPAQLENNLRSEICLEFVCFYSESHLLFLFHHIRSLLVLYLHFFLLSVVPAYCFVIPGNKVQLLLC